MTERLGALLEREAEGVAVPPMPLGAITRRGRVIRRRKAAMRGLGAVAALAVISAGIGITGETGAPASAQARFENAAPAPAYETYGAFSVDSTVYVGNHKVDFDYKIKSLYYTSLGVLVRMGDKEYLDEHGRSRYTLISPTGDTRDITLNMGDRIPATNPDSPYVAYLEPTGADWSFVVLDLRTNKEVARRILVGKFTWGGWEAPPAATAGNRAWGLFDEGWMEFDWAAGTTRLIPGTAQTGDVQRGDHTPTIDNGGGRFVGQVSFGLPDPSMTPEEFEQETRESLSYVQDFAATSEIRSFPAQNGAWISPDGRFVRIGGSMGGFDEAGDLVDPPGPSKFLDVETGATVSLPGDYFYGWTPDGNALSVDPAADQIRVCRIVTGKCDLIRLEIEDGKVKLGGAIYES